jgi:hypothetical protein
MPISPDILAVTHTELMKTIPDALARSNALLNKLVKKRSMPFNGGNLTFQFPVAILDNEAEGWIDGSTDVISTNPNQEMVYGQLTYKKFYSNVVVSLNDIAATDDSPNAIASLIEIKKNVAQNTMTRTVSASVYGSGTTSNKALNGFGDIFGASGTAYAGINNTDYPTWYPQADTTSTVISYDVISNGLASLSAINNQQPISDGLVSSYKPDLMVSKPNIQSRFKSQLQVQQRFADEATVKAGFENLVVDGIPWVVDDFAPANTLYILSSTSMHFGIRYGFWSGRKSRLDNSQVLPNQPITVSTGYHVGNLYCENRRVNWFANSLSA